jgi:uncharacterized protein (DUF1330 family)
MELLETKGALTMPRAYWVVTYRSLRNPAAWQAYAAIAKPAITAAGGRFLALAKPAKTYELGMNETVVLVEFDDLAKAIACHDAPAYQQALRALGSGNVERDIRIVEGAS